MTAEYNPDLVPWTPPLETTRAASSRADRIRIIRQVLASPANHGLSQADIAALIVDELDRVPR